jgi:Tfp pilus assembly protein PilX
MSEPDNTVKHHLEEIVRNLRQAEREMKKAEARVRDLEYALRQAREHLGQMEEVEDVGHACQLGVTDCDADCSNAAWSHRRNELRKRIDRLLKVEKAAT